MSIRTSHFVWRTLFTLILVTTMSPWLVAQTMPAGVYTVQEDTFHHCVILRNKAATRSFAYALRPGDPASNEVHVALRFEASGDTHILRGIQFGPKMTSRLDNGPVPYERARLSQGR